MSSSSVCAACRRTIDASAKLCPYCGANPATGERVDTQAILQQIFSTRTMSTGESVLEYARQRQGIVIAVSVFVAFILLALILQFISMRNARDVSDAPAVPLTEVADLANQKDESAPRPLPPLDFQYEGQPKTMRTYIIERGAVPPPEVVAAQQAAAAAQTQPQPAPPHR